MSVTEAPANRSSIDQKLAEVQLALLKKIEHGLGHLPSSSIAELANAYATLQTGEPRSYVPVQPMFKK